jgi:hypothetical protein
MNAIAPSRVLTDNSFHEGTTETLLRRATFGNAPEHLCISFGWRGSGQREHRELSAERGVIAQRSIATHRTQAVMRVGKASRKANPGPAADT